jgi:dipeptidyl aminopeptidase/acylaminoacyl peptidase
MSNFRMLVPLASLWLIASASAFAQSPRAMTLVDLINVPALTDPQLSPDGKQLLFVRSDASWKEDKRVTHVWRTVVSTGETVQLTNGERGESGARWSPDGRQIAFIARRGDNDESQIFLLNASGGEAQQVTSHATSPSDITWSLDGSALFFIAPEAKSAEQQEREKLKDDVYSFDEDFQQKQLWTLDVATRTESRVTSGAYSVMEYDLSRDGKRITYERAPDPQYGSQELAELWIMDANGANAQQLTNNHVDEGRAVLSPDNTLIAFTSASGESFEPYYETHIFIVPANGGTPRRLLGSGSYSVSDVEWAEGSKSLFFTAGIGVHSELFRLDLASNKVTQITKGAHTIRSWRYNPAAGMHVLAFDEATNPGDVYLLGAAASSVQPTRVTHVFDDIGTRYRLPRQEKVEWQGADGVTVEGLLFYPLDYTAGTRYPLVVQTHGGPQSADQFGFGSVGSYVQVLSALGYAVLKPNYRGSTGYGDVFVRDMVGHYFQNAHLDVLAGVDKVIQMGVADPDRLAAMGWSAGGHMTNKLITFTDRFKAASSGAGAANWVSMYAQSDVRSYRTPWFGGTPWQKDAPIDVYWNNSPLKDVSKVRTPTQFLVGEKDQRVPMPQSVEMFRALKTNGIPTRLFVAPREPHGWTELRHQLFKANAELEWFEKYVRGRSYIWEKAPAEPKKAPERTAMP